MELPAGVKKNNIPFYVIKDRSVQPEGDRYFTLYPNKGWNDYGIVSIFSVNYYENGSAENIGSTKIIHKNEDVTWQQLPQKFRQLDENFCSLSSEENFYYSLKQRFGERELIGILFALQDAAYFPHIHDGYARHLFTSSLLRSDAAERILREIKPKLRGNDLENLYNFDYKFKPAYSTEPIRITLDFNNTGEVPSRIIAVIGKNGTGKTQLMSCLPNSFARSEYEDFYNKIPNFSKIIAVSYSVFGDLDPDKNTFEQVIDSALVVKKVLDALDVPAYPKTSGSTGMHIYIPLEAKYTYDQTQLFGRIIAKLVHEQIPEYTSIERQIKNRKGKMYVDFLQNRPGATIAGPYSLRPKPGATVSMPLSWDEVKPGLTMRDFTIRNAVSRLKETGDLFKGVLGKGIDLEEAVKKAQQVFSKG